MSDALSFVEVDGQHMELLPARTVLTSIFGALGNLAGNNSPGGDASSSGHTISNGGNAYSSPINQGGDGKGIGGLLNALGSIG